MKEQRVARAPRGSRLRREVAGAFLLKLAALALLWALCFSPAHRQPVGSEAASRRLGLPAVHEPSRPRADNAPGARGGEP